MFEVRNRPGIGKVNDNLLLELLGAAGSELVLVGGQALVTGHPLESLYRQIRALRLAEGASDVLRLNLVRGDLELGKGRL